MLSNSKQHNQKIYYTVIYNQHHRAFHSHIPNEALLIMNVIRIQTYTTRSSSNPRTMSARYVKSVKCPSKINIYGYAIFEARTMSVLFHTNHQMSKENSKLCEKYI